MFARSVSFHLRPGRSAEFTQVFEKEIVPMLRKQTGFQDEIALLAPDGANAVAISVWDLKENAENYARTGYSGVLKALTSVIDGAPQVQTYGVSHSTFHKIVGPVTA
jgi:heme-degrading monooxygenase HmoA